MIVKINNIVPFCNGSKILKVVWCDSQDKFQKNQNINLIKTRRHGVLPKLYILRAVALKQIPQKIIFIEIKITIRKNLK